MRYDWYRDCPPTRPPDPLRSRIALAWRRLRERRTDPPEVASGDRQDATGLCSLTRPGKDGE